MKLKIYFLIQLPANFQVSYSVWSLANELDGADKDLPSHQQVLVDGTPRVIFNHCPSQSPLSSSSHSIL